MDAPWARRCRHPSRSPSLSFDPSASAQPIKLFRSAELRRASPVGQFSCEPGAPLGRMAAVTGGGEGAGVDTTGVIKADLPRSPAVGCFTRLASVAGLGAEGKGFGHGLSNCTSTIGVRAGGMLTRTPQARAVSNATCTRIANERPMTRGPTVARRRLASISGKTSTRDQSASRRRMSKRWQARLAFKAAFPVT
jgi:hypothetical protein